MATVRFLPLALLVLAALSLSLVFAAPPAADADEEVRYIVKFKSRGHGRGLDAMKQHGIRAELEDDQYGFIAARMNRAKKDAMEKNPNVEFVEEDAIREPTQYQMVYPGIQTLPHGVNMILDGFVDPDNGAVSNTPKVVLCIIDSGYDVTHEDLPKTKVTGVNNIGTGTWSKDSCRHGTHVAGTAVALNNNKGVVGVIPNLGRVILHVVKVFGADSGSSCSWTYSSSLVHAFSQCQSKASATQKLVVSMSLGGSYNSSIENYAFQNAYNTGRVLSVAAAGNGGSTAFSFPASYPSVISVGCVTKAKGLCSVSQRNSQVDLVAPGHYVTSTIPTGYAVYSGTSMSTPHVSAAAALLWGFHSGRTNADIWASLKNTAEDLGTKGRDNSFGSGLISVRRAYKWLTESGTRSGATASPTPTPKPIRTPKPSPTLTPGISDMCSTAKAIPCGKTFHASIDSATATDPDSINDGIRDQWYSFRGKGYVTTVSTCNAMTNINTVVEVYTGTCASLTPLVSNDNMASCSSNRLASAATFTGNKGTTYYIRVRPSSKTQTSGRYAINIACSASVSSAT